MTAAIFGLLGVLVGGVLNLAAARVADHRQRANAARTAALILLHDAMLRRDLLLGLSRGEVPFSIAAFPPFVVWEAQRDALAGGIKTEEWYFISWTYSMLQAKALDVPAESEPLTDAIRRSLWFDEHWLDAMQSILLTVIGGGDAGAIARQQWASLEPNLPSLDLMIHPQPDLPSHLRRGAFDPPG